MSLDSNVLFEEFSWVFELTPIIERNLFASAHAYEYAINIVRHLGDNEKQRLYLLTKRLGNVRNEMGVYWMNRCAQALKNLVDQDTSKVRRKIWKIEIGFFFHLGNQRIFSKKF